MKWRIYKEETEDGAFKVGDRVRVVDTYKGKSTSGGRFSYDPPSSGMTGTVVGINRQRYHDFKSGSMGLGMSREKTKMWYIVKIDDSCRKGCFVPGEYGFDEKDLVKIDAVNESDEEVNIKKLLKMNGVTKLPSGTQFKPDRVSWSKDGGYAGQKTLRNLCIQLEHAGWKRGEWRTGGIPDGSAVSNSNIYTSPDGKIVMSYYEHFGVTAHDNYYSFTFKLAGGQVNEARITGAGRVDFDDDIVAVYTPDGKLEYKGLFDDCPYKDEPMQYDRRDMVYRFEAENGDYRTMVKLAESCNESSRFGFNVGDMVELTKDKSNTFTGETVKAGTQGEVVAVDKPMPGVIKVKIEGGKVVSVPERQLKKAGEDEEPWKKLKAPEQPKRVIRPERPEDYYMRPTSYGSPRYTGD